ncbi:MAG TPA: hypothetical protein VFT66_13690 [Roseiflexaceae bacterium]|jgi:hypothetical protein|nr:hypothetical protein [Roseiflexaceae bacterium]
MTQQPFERTSRSGLTNIREGMDVYDSDGKHIGTVERVHFGASVEGVQTATPGDADLRGNSFLDDLARVFTTDDVPDEVRRRLLQEGFIRIDADGIFASDRYVTLEHVASVASDRVTLSVPRDQLVKS